MNGVVTACLCALLILTCAANFGPWRRNIEYTEEQYACRNATQTYIETSISVAAFRAVCDEYVKTECTFAIASLVIQCSVAHETSGFWGAALGRYCPFDGDDVALETALQDAGFLVII